jgi:hypothetical protein
MKSLLGDEEVGCEPRDHVVTQPIRKDIKFSKSQVNQV